MFCFFDCNFSIASIRRYRSIHSSTKSKCNHFKMEDYELVFSWGLHDFRCTSSQIEEYKLKSLIQSFSFFLFNICDKTTISLFQRYSYPCWLIRTLISIHQNVVVCSTLWYLLLEDWIERIILLFGNPLFISIGHTEGTLNSFFFLQFKKELEWEL